ncbi:heavy-metal-associated domain-containing protein [Nitriliruptor alkaliphilus]|uniref:heavy-metal-associated domain-containing protein n=1 Tax=Nitriliruptor alkaliphilus TaxID=427918 RepID=UPI0012EDA8EF|nr:hypothetical protein [Nitriliruptor alkaliphilus]
MPRHDRRGPRGGPRRPSAVLDLETKRTTVRYDPSRVEEDALVTTLTDAGYAPAT